jgi:hypothetical protein
MINVLDSDARFSPLSIIFALSRLSALNQRSKCSGYRRVNHLLIESILTPEAAISYAVELWQFHSRGWRRQQHDSREYARLHQRSSNIPSLCTSRSAIV